MRATCPVRLILFDLVTLLMFGVAYKLSDSLLALSWKTDCT